MIQGFFKVYYMFTDDLSYNKNASQSRTYLGLSKFSASLAVDRNTSSCMRTSEIGLHSTSQTMWWKVDLGRVYSIHSVIIIFKTYEGYGMYYLMLLFFQSVKFIQYLSFLRSIQVSNIGCILRNHSLTEKSTANLYL